MGVQSYGVAPFWVDTSDVDYEVAQGYTGIAILASTAGTVRISNGLGTVDVTVQAGVPFPAHFRSIDADNSTATGVLAALIK